MGKAWIEDSERPGGIGRSERERLFWERVASGRPTFGQPRRRRSSRRYARPNHERAATKPTKSTKPTVSTYTRRGLHAARAGAEDPGGPWESLRLAAVTMLTVIVFGLGWVTLELERVAAPNGYAWLPISGLLSGSDFRAERAEFTPQPGFELNGRNE